MNTYNSPTPHRHSDLSPRQANKLARFKQAFITTDRNDRPIVVLDEGPKPAVTAMAIYSNRLAVGRR